MKNIIATFFTAFIVSGTTGASILLLMAFPVKQAIFTGVFSGLVTGLVLALMVRRNQKALKL
ncbi:hypothetical protein [Mucilaginibacter sp. CSA2-8R]|uniref:hypothetical protein n=1 Tax=Mucilaginibacter sp. CSA2-8R TaxID=3141542 RepID=UPI00315CA489